MIIHLTGPLKDLVNSDQITVPNCMDTVQLVNEIRKSLPGIDQVPYRIAVNGKIIGNKCTIKEKDRLELITLLQGG